MFNGFISEELVMSLCQPVYVQPPSDLVYAALIRNCHLCSACVSISCRAAPPTCLPTSISCRAAPPHPPVEVAVNIIQQCTHHLSSACLSVCLCVLDCLRLCLLSLSQYQGELSAECLQLHNICFSTKHICSNTYTYTPVTQHHTVNLG